MKLFILLCFATGGAYAERSCGENQSYDVCGTVCPLTCKNYFSPRKPCSPMCVGGCFCHKGYVKTHNGTCVRPEECGDEKPKDPACYEPYQPGGCHAYIERYFFDHQETGRCKRFIYGGCNANKNNFFTLEQCLKACGGPVVQSLSTSDCQQYPDSGNCNAYMPRYYFDSFSGSCKTFMYGGCGGNTNNFKTEEECNAHCIE